MSGTVWALALGALVHQAAGRGRGLAPHGPGPRDGVDMEINVDRVTLDATGAIYTRPLLYGTTVDANEERYENLLNEVVKLRNEVNNARKSNSFVDNVAANILANLFVLALGYICAAALGYIRSNPTLIGISVAVLLLASTSGVTAATGGVLYGISNGDPVETERAKSLITGGILFLPVSVLCVLAFNLGVSIGETTAALVAIAVSLALILIVCIIYYRTVMFGRNIERWATPIIWLVVVAVIFDFSLYVGAVFA